MCILKIPILNVWFFHIFRYIKKTIIMEDLEVSTTESSNVDDGFNTVEECFEKCVPDTEWCENIIHSVIKPR